MLNRIPAVLMIAAIIASLGTPLRAAEPAAADPEDERRADKPFLLRPFFSISYMGLVADGMNLEPLPLTSVGASVGWGRFKVSASKKVDLVEPEPEDEGTPFLESDVLDLSLALSLPVKGRELVLAPFYSRATGAQVVIDTHVQSTDTPIDYIEDRFDVRLRGYGIDALYCWNPRFSYDDRLLELKPRAHSSATLILRTSLGRAELASDGRPLGGNTGWNAPLARTVSFGASYAGAMAGVAYQWLIIGRLSLFGMATLGGTVSSSNAQMSDGSREREVAVRPSFSANTGLGFVGYTLHFGLVVYTSREAVAIGDDGVGIQRITSLLFLGLRL